MKLKKVLTVVMAAVMAISAMTVCAASDELNASAEVFAMSVEETAARGFLIIDGDVFDLGGNILIDLTNGLTPDGYALDPEFRVTYPEAVSADAVSPMSVGTNIFNGTVFVDQNENGYQGTAVGNVFHLTSTYPNVYVKYVSGTPDINVSIYNKGRGTVIDWVPGLNPGSDATLIGYATDDDCVLMASADGMAASVRLQAYTTE